MKSLVLVLVFLAWFAFPACADFDAGVAAHERGDYATALREFQPLAENGNALAQYNTGQMYRRGEGVPQDYKEAARWFRLAAEQGHANSQAMLGYMYLGGEGVLQDNVVAHMWLNLAAAQGQKEAPVVRDILAKQMTPAQIAEAQRLAREWKPKR